jgi:hypothetical protein
MVNTCEENLAATQINVVLNWKLNQRVPVK